MNNGGDQHPEQDAQHPIPQLGEVRQRSKPAEKGQRKGETNLDPGVGDTLRAGGNPRRQRQHRQGHRQQARQRIGQGWTKTINSSASREASSAPPMRSHVFCIVAPSPGWATITQLSIMVCRPCQSAAV